MLRSATSVRRRAFVLPWLCSAGLVTVIRALHAADLRYDLAIQLEAARNLLSGHGLTMFSVTSHNIADPLTLVTLTHFPAGYSLCAAVLMLAGATPSFVIKLLGAAATLLGWWGWAVLSFQYLQVEVERNRRWLAIGWFTGLVTPLLFTLPWGGTDIILWACVPWIALLLTPTQSSAETLRSHFVAGVLTALSLLMRYAAVFLIPFAFAAIAWQSRWRLRPLIGRAALFAIGLAPAALVQGWVFMSSAAPSAVASAGGLKIASAAAHSIVRHVFFAATANVAVFFWMPNRVLHVVTDDTAVAQALALVLLLVLPMVVIYAIARDSTLTARAFPMSAMLLLPTIPVFLWTCEMLGAAGYAGLPRYYAPVIPLALLLFGFLATAGAHGAARFGRIGRMLGRGYLLAFLVLTTSRVLLSVGAGDAAMNQRAKIVGTTQLRGWPSFGLTFDGSAANREVAALLRSEPDAILITNVDHWLSVDPTLDLSRVRHMQPCRQLKSDVEVRGPAHVFILASDLGGPPRELYTFGERSRQRAPCFEALQPVVSVRYFPEEMLKLLECRIPAGARIALMRPSAPPEVEEESDP